MPFRPPNFSPVQPLSTGAALSKTLAGVLHTFGVRKDREKQQRQELLAALELQDLKQQNATALAELQSKLRTEEGQDKFRREEPIRKEKIQTEKFNRLDELSSNFDLTEPQIADIDAGRFPRGTLKRKPFRPTTASTVERRTIDKENRAKENSLGGRTIPQLVDDLRATGKLAVRDAEGKLTGKREFTTPEHEQTFNFTQNILEMKKAGLNDKVLEELNINPDEAISQYSEIKQGTTIQTGPPDKPGGPAVGRLLTNTQIVKLIKAGVSLENINNAMTTLRQRPEYSKFTDERLLKLILRSIE